MDSFPLSDAMVCVEQLVPLKGQKSKTCQNKIQHTKTNRKKWNWYKKLCKLVVKKGKESDKNIFDNYVDNYIWGYHRPQRLV